MSNVLISSIDGTIMIPKKLIKSFEIMPAYGQYCIVAKTKIDEFFTMGMYSEKETAIEKLESLVSYCYEVIAFEKEKI